MIVKGTQTSGAIFSDCMNYRYRLWRCWNETLPRALFILLNPSTADDIDNDPTVERQMVRVRKWGAAELFTKARTAKVFGSLEVVNGCALRSTDPAQLFKVDDPVGPENGEHIALAVDQALESGGVVVCGWGKHLREVSAGKYDLEQLLLESLGSTPLSALKLNKDGTPAHPLYIDYGIKPRRWHAEALHEEVV